MVLMFDAHELRGVAVLGGGAHRLAEFRVEDEQLQHDHHHDRQHNDEDLLGRDIDRADVKDRIWEDTSGNGTGEGPRQYCMMFSRMNDMPIAVMSGASRGALRNRRYASRSTSTPVMPHSSIATKIVRIAVPISAQPCSSPCHAEQRQDGQ